MGRRFAAWIRYGDVITDEQVQFAAEHYSVAVLQPWETQVLARLKSARPDMQVLCYKCLSSTRSYEPGPVYSSGVSYAEAEAEGGRWFARRSGRGPRIEWNGYPGHWQMKVWDAGYRARWARNVTAELEGSLWDGVMADNDVFDDYYGLRLPRRGRATLRGVRRGLEALVELAGRSLNAVDKILVPNIAESRREPGRWQRHAAFGGGFDEVFLAWGPEQHLDAAAAFAQGPQLHGPGWTVVRTATDGSPRHHNVLYGLAAFWIFGAGRPGTAYAATAHDAYSGTAFVPEMNWDLGEPVTDMAGAGTTLWRAFSDGFVAANFAGAGTSPVEVVVPPGHVDVSGRAVVGHVSLHAHHGLVLRRDAG